MSSRANRHAHHWRIPLSRVIDTGFNGDLELPESLFEHFEPRWEFKAVSALAADVKVKEDVYSVRFPFDGRVIEAEATFARGNEILIGTGLLRDDRVTINFVSRTVRLQRVHK